MTIEETHLPKPAYPSDSKAHYSSLIMNLPYGVALHEIEVDATGDVCNLVYRDGNSVFEEHSGLKLQDIVNRRVTDVIPGILETDLIETYGEVALTGNNQQLEFFFPPLDKWFSVLAYRPMANHVATLSQDITKAKLDKLKLEKSRDEAIKEIVRKNEELTQFAYRATHDLKAPLTSSRELLFYILQDIELNEIEEAKANINAIKYKIEKLESLITNISSLTKADLAEHYDENLDFQDIFNESAIHFDALSKNSKQSIKLIDNTDRVIKLPRVRIQQIFNNLISNGIKFGDKKKEQQFVNVTVSNGNENLHIKIEDNGLGIPSEYIDKIFDIFQRFHPKIESGSGLGLGIVSKHVEQMGGTIDVCSSVGVGTTFKIEIPIGGQQ